MNIKKTFVTLASLVLAFSSFTASAAINVPQPKNNSEAYAYALAFYKDGYYYEAKQELEMVDPNGWDYDKEKQAAWMLDIDAKIEKLQYDAIRAQVKKHIANAKALNSKWLFEDAMAEIEAAAALPITVAEYELLDWWYKALEKNMGLPQYQPVRSNYTAIKAVEAEHPLASSYESFYAIKIAEGFWHVYTTTLTPNGSRDNVAAYHVYANGAVVKVWAK